MLRRAVVLLAACSPDPSNRPLPTDAPPDEACIGMDGYTPITAIGTTPFGAFDLRYAQVGFASCGVVYSVSLTEKMVSVRCTPQNLLLLQFDAYRPDHALAGAGDIQVATAKFFPAGAYGADPAAETMHAEFRVEHLEDFTTGTPLTVRGRFVSTDPAFVFDIPIDSVVHWADNCL